MPKRTIKKKKSRKQKSHIPNKITLRAMRDTEAQKNLTQIIDADDMMRKIFGSDTVLKNVIARKERSD